MMNGDYFGDGYGMMGYFGDNWIFMMLFWVVIIAAAIYFVKWIAENNKSDTKEKTAIEILKERYAKGEIDKDEFEEKKKSLM